MNATRTPSDIGTLLFAFGVAALFAILSLAGFDFPAPSDWLEKWTSWIYTVATTVVAIRVFWYVAPALATYLRTH
jgi:hypothetical protein